MTSKLDMRFSKKILSLNSLLIGVILSLALGLGIGIFLGRRELIYLMNMPSGAMHMSSTTGALWSKPPENSQTLVFLRIPDPDQARVVNLFASPNKQSTRSESVEEKKEK